MSLLNAYLTFDGNAAEAMRFYEKTLGGKMEMLMTVGESPEAANMPPEAANFTPVTANVLLAFFLTKSA